MFGNEAAHAQFLKLIIGRLTSPAPLDPADVNAMLGEMAELVGTSGAYVILLGRRPDGSISMEGRFTSYASDARGYALSARELANFSDPYRDEPLVVADSEALSPQESAITEAMRERGLRAALMVTVHRERRTARRRRVQ